MKILITGVAGFIGSQLAIKLANKAQLTIVNNKIIDIKVVGFFNLSKYILENLRGLEFSFSLT